MPQGYAVPTSHTVIMIDHTIDKIEATVRAAETIQEDLRRELLGLLNTLKSEITELSKTNADQARSITGFAELSAHEATRENQNPQLLEHSLAGMQAAVDGFEKSHPRLVQAVNSISQTLSNLGI